MLERALKIISSLKLTIVLLAFGIALVFFGTLAQVDEGLYAAQNRWFRSFFVVDHAFSLSLGCQDASRMRASARSSTF